MQEGKNLKPPLSYFWQELTLFIIGGVSQHCEQLAKLTLCPLETPVQSLAAETSWLASIYFYSFSLTIHHHPVWGTCVTALCSLSHWAGTWPASVGWSCPHSELLGKHSFPRGAQSLLHNTIMNSWGKKQNTVKSWKCIKRQACVCVCVCETGYSSISKSRRPLRLFHTERILLTNLSSFCINTFF